MIFHQNLFSLNYDSAGFALFHTDPQDLSQCSRLDLLHVTDSNRSHTGFWDDPLPLTIVPKIICSRCSCESREASSSWSLRFEEQMFSSAFPTWPLACLLTWAEPSQTKPSLAGSDPISLSSNAEISTVSQSGLWKCHCFTETTERMKVSACVTPEKRQSVNL